MQLKEKPKRRRSRQGRDWACILKHPLKANTSLCKCYSNLKRIGYSSDICHRDRGIRLLRSKWMRWLSRSCSGESLRANRSKIPSHTSYLRYTKPFALIIKFNRSENDVHYVTISKRPSEIRPDHLSLSPLLE